MLAQLLSVEKYYNNPAEPVLRGISLSVNAGDTIAITGPSGSGKTTLLNILGTIDYPSSGKIFLDGKDMTGLDRKERTDLRNRFIGFVFQQHQLLPQLSLLENILLPTLAGKSQQRDQITERAFHLMERVGIKLLANKFPGKVSVGEQQRAAVVRALINKPNLLLADEPTGSLDNENALKLADLLTKLNKEEGIALIVVTHSDEVASMMNIRYRLHSGKLQLQS